MSPSFLCEFLAGRQGLSKERVRWICQKLNFSADQTEHFWDLVEAKFGRTEQVKKTARFRALTRSRSAEGQLTMDKFRVIADWHCFIVLEILTVQPNAKPRDVALMLGLEVSVVRESMERLMKVGLLEMVKAEGRITYRPATEASSTVEDGPEAAVRVAHRQLLRQHAEWVEIKPMSDRESLNICFSLSGEDWPQFRAELKRAVVALAAKYTATDKVIDQTVSLALQAVALIPNEEKK